MKKFLSVLMIFAVLLSFCACGGKTAQEDAAEGNQNSAEAQFGHIDQKKPVDGFYKLWNAEGVKFMMENHPDGKFELLLIPSPKTPPNHFNPASSFPSGLN